MNVCKIKDFSGVVTAGGTSQAALPANEARKGGFIQNPGDATEVLYVDFGLSLASDTAKTSIELAAGQILRFDENLCVIDAVNVTAVTTGHKYIAKAAI